MSPAIAGSSARRSCGGCARRGSATCSPPRRDQLDLRDQAAVNYWFEANRPEYVFMVAGTVGGIHANSTRPAEFIYDNLMMHATVVHACYLHGAKRLLYLGSSCIYPRETAQPIREEELLTGLARAHQRALRGGQDLGHQALPGLPPPVRLRLHLGDADQPLRPGRHLRPAGGHVLPALMRRFHEARAAGAGEVTVWGTGTPRREFLHVDDLADACVFLMRRYENRDQHVNVGTGDDLTIRELAEMVRDVVAPGLELGFDRSKPDGMPRKLLDVSRLHALGWRHKIGLREGIESTYRWFLEHQGSGELRVAVGAGSKR